MRVLKRKSEMISEEMLAKIVEEARGRLHLPIFSIGKGGNTVNCRLKEGDLSAGLGQIIPICSGSSPEDFEYVNPQVIPENDWIYIGASNPKVYYKGIGGVIELGLQIMAQDYKLLESKLLEKRRNYEKFGIPLDNFAIIHGTGGTGGGGGPILAYALSKKYNVRIIDFLIIPSKFEGRGSWRNLYKTWRLLESLLNKKAVNNIFIIDNGEIGLREQPSPIFFDAINSRIVERWQLIFGQGTWVMHLDPKDIEATLDRGKGICLLNSKVEEVPIGRGESFRVEDHVRRLVNEMLSTYDTKTLETAKSGLISVRGDQSYLTHSALLRAQELFEQMCPNAIVKTAQWPITQRYLEVGILIAGTEYYKPLDDLLQLGQRWVTENEVEFCLDYIEKMEVL
jgi:cell division GTPase FtsZ